MGYGRKNHVNLDWLSYNIFLLGQMKIGKTTLIREACEKTAGPDGYLFLELGQERGADAIEGINYINCPTWDMPYDELTNSIGFADIVDDIVRNKNTEYKDLRVVVWDTYDQLINMAEEKTIALHNRKHAADPIDTINSAFGGFGKGLDKALSLMLDKMAELRSVGVATIVIGHVKTKDVTDVVSGESYQTLTSDQTQKYFNGLAKNMHFMGLAYIDRNIAKEKTGKKITVDGKKVDEFINKITSESRKIKFRDDSYCLDCGGRFADIVSEVPLDADAFIKAINDAILAEQAKSSQTLAQAQKAQADYDKKVAERVAKNEKENREKEQIAVVINEVIGAVKSNMQNKALQTEIMAYCKQNGFANPKEITDLNVAKGLQEIIKKY